MSNIVPLYYNKKLIFTADGSISLYNLDYGEAYHAVSMGAYTESLHKYVLASGILKKILNKDMKLLDICFGIGLNLAVTIEKIAHLKKANNLSIVSLEKDKSLIHFVNKSYFLWPVDGYKILRKLIETGVYQKIHLKLNLCDAVEYLMRSNDKFDIIYYDPFSRSKTPAFWDAVLINKLYNLIQDGGCLVTYAGSNKIIKTFYKAGFNSHNISKHTGSFLNSVIFYKP